MRKPILTLAALLLIGGSVFAESYRVHYSVRGSGRDITVQAESSPEARQDSHGRVPRCCGDGGEPDQVGSPVLN